MCHLVPGALRMAALKAIKIFNMSILVILNMERSKRSKSMTVRKKRKRTRGKKT